MEKVYVGLLGMGTVATGFLKTLELNKDKIFKLLDKEIIVKKILVKKLDKKRDFDTSKLYLTNNFKDILEDEEISIVIELIGGLKPSFEYIKKSLMSGKDVVTANKALVATYSKELFFLCEEYNKSLRFEASVGGGIPIINTITNNLVSNKIEKLTGIINGTTNFILTQMTDSGMDFDEAVKLAQDMGYAEADPTSDLAGEDAVFKLSILSEIAFGKKVSPNNIPSNGIESITREDIRFADELGYVIKLLAYGDNSCENLELSVGPSFVSKAHPLASVKNEFNALYLEGNSLGEIMLYGKGAGAMPTGSSILEDVIYIIKSDTKSNLLQNDKKTYTLNSNKKHRYYVPMKVVDKVGILGKIALSFGDESVSIESVVQKNSNNNICPLIFITHAADINSINQAIKRIKTFDFVESVENIIKIID